MPETIKVVQCRERDHMGEVIGVIISRYSGYGLKEPNGLGRLLGCDYIIPHMVIYTERLVEMLLNG